MKKITVILFTLASLLMLQTPSVQGQTKGYDYKFYGYVRNMYYYNTRASSTALNELFYRYPLNERLDANGVDLNDKATSTLIPLHSRLGLNVGGIKLGSSIASAKIETDFGGFGANTYLLRLRHAFINLDWNNKHQLLVGQTWHPMFGEVYPYTIDLSTGAPFQPFNRSPQIRYTLLGNGVKLTAAMLWQLQTVSYGPSSTGANIASKEFQLNSNIPEFFLGADFKAGDWTIGAGAKVLTIVRKESVFNSKTYKVDESLTTMASEFHIAYRKENFSFLAKTTYGTGMDNLNMLGGFAVKTQKSQTGEQEYTPFRHSATWMGLTYGKKWKWHLLAGYTKNLGTVDDNLAGTGDTYVASRLYGRGVDIDQLVGGTVGLTYNVGSLSLGAEYDITDASYGSVTRATGKVDNTSNITNHRFVTSVTLKF